jgi:hypothetical protein
LTAAYEHARSICRREDMLTARAEATVASLGAILDGADLTGVVDRLTAAVSAADPTGRPLFGGLSRQSWPDGVVGHLWRSCELIREHRGDSHVAASIGRGLGPIAMNVLTELWLGMPLGSYSATRGWAPDQIDATAAALAAAGLVDDGHLTPAGQTYRDDLEATTDAMEASLVDALGADCDAVIAQLDDWSAQCIAGGSFPPDAFKRAAG